MSRMTDYCDLCCDECGHWTPTTCTTLKAARKAARTAGWSVKGNQDLCPECTEKRKAWKAMTK